MWGGRISYTEAQQREWALYYLQVYACALHRYKRDNEASYRNKPSVFHNTGKGITKGYSDVTHTDTLTAGSFADNSWTTPHWSLHHGENGITKSCLWHAAKTCYLGMRMSERVCPPTAKINTTAGVNTVEVRTSALLHLFTEKRFKQVAAATHMRGLFKTAGLMAPSREGV